MSYHVGLRECFCQLRDSASLKDKRQVLQSVKTRVQKKWNLSVAEVEHQDDRQLFTLAFVGVGSSKQKVEQELTRAYRLLEQSDQVEILDTFITFL